jgi:hypothetical protein
MKTVLARRQVAAERLLVDDEMICREAMSASTTRHAL